MSMCRVISICLFLGILVATGSALTATATEDSAAKRPVRVAVVNTPYFSGLLEFLLPEFEKTSGYKTEIYNGTDVYDHAQSGNADIVISHYGKEELEDFILDGYGAWPRMVFSNQMAIIGPSDDPAGIKGFASATAAFKQIAETKSPYILNNLNGVRYLTQILFEGAGRPDKKNWFLDTGEGKGRALKLAEQKNGYVIFGAIPFLKFKKKHNSKLEILISDDSVLQRVMASTVVNPKKIEGINLKGAEALQAFLLEPRTQARIAAFRSEGSNTQLWWPAARSNATSSLLGASSDH